MPFSFQLPLITDLTVDQRHVLDDVKSLGLKGGPGTGKSVVSLWRHIRNHSLGSSKSLLLTYTKCLELYLASSAKSENEEASIHVNRTLWWTHHDSGKIVYDEIIIDEAQDISHTTAQAIKTKTKQVCFGADDRQGLYSGRLKYDQLKELYSPNSEYSLSRNFRNSSSISRFIASLLQNTSLTQGSKAGPKPQLIRSGNDINRIMKIITDIIETFSSDTHNIAVLLPLVKVYGHRPRNVKFYYDNFKDRFECSMFQNDDTAIDQIASVHFSSFKSAKGLEFDTVIIPEFEHIYTDIKKLKVITENDYYVALTRAKTNLIMIDNYTTKENGWNFLTKQIEHNIIDLNTSYVEDNSQISDEKVSPF